MSHIHTRLLDVIGQFDDGFGVRICVETLDGKCAYSEELDRDETKTLCKALDGSTERQRLEDARAQVQRLESDNEELRAAVAQMTEGTPFAWGYMIEGRPAGVSYAGEDRSPHYDIPLFRAVQPSPDAAELAAQVEAIGKERDALQARVDTLTAGENLTKNALAAAEKDRDGWKAGQAHAQQCVENAMDHTRREKARAEAAEAHAANLGTLAATAEKRALAAEARVKVLEGSREPVGWFSGDGKGYTFCPNKGFNTHPGEGFDPLYRHPPKPAGEPVAWRVAYGKKDAFTTSVSDLAARHGASGARVTPLYEAPPVALGVEGEVFGCLVKGSDYSFFRPIFNGGSVGTRSMAERRAEDDDSASVVRIVPADAKTVDVAAIREAIGELAGIHASHAYRATALLCAAIGEKS